MFEGGGLSTCVRGGGGGAYRRQLKLSQVLQQLCPVWPLHLVRVQSSPRFCLLLQGLHEPKWFIHTVWHAGCRYTDLIRGGIMGGLCLRQISRGFATLCPEIIVSSPDLASISRACTDP